MFLTSNRIVSLTVLVLSIYVASLTYEEISIQSRSSLLTSELLVIGNKKYSLLYNNNCIGNFSAEFAKEDNSHIFKGNGNLTIRNSSDLIESNFKFEIIFNELDQLGGSIVTVRTGDQEIRFGTTGIDPITFKFKFPSVQNNLNNLLKAYEISFPGPITLVKVKDNAFGLNFNGLPTIDKIGDYYSQVNGFKTSEIFDGNFCNVSSEKTLDISKFLAILKNFKLPQ